MLSQWQAVKASFSAFLASLGGERFTASLTSDLHCTCWHIWGLIHEKFWQNFFAFFHSQNCPQVFSLVARHFVTLKYRQNWVCHEARNLLCSMGKKLWQVQFLVTSRFNWTNVNCNKLSKGVCKTETFMFMQAGSAATVVKFCLITAIWASWSVFLLYCVGGKNVLGHFLFTFLVAWSGFLIGWWAHEYIL